MNWLLSKINRELGEYYAGKMQHDDASMQVGWKNRQAQMNRFDQLVKVVPADPSERFSVNDLGCGFGDFSEYLAARDFHDFTYNGYDLFDSMLTEAARLHGKYPNRRFIKIAEFNDMHPADYTVTSGILNLKFTIPEHEWLYYVLETISMMNAKSAKGFAFNALTKYSDREFMKDELYYADPCFLFDYCKRNISKNVALLHDYKEYDFTIIVRKT